MIKKLFNFGNYIPEKYFEDNPLNLNLDYGKEDSKIVFLCFEKTNDFFEFKNIQLEDYDKTKNKNLYLLKNAKGNSVSPFPTLFFEVSSIIKGQIDFSSKSWGKFLRIVENNSNISENLKNLYFTIKDLNEISLEIVLFNQIFLTIFLILSNPLIIKFVLINGFSSIIKVYDDSG